MKPPVKTMLKWGAAVLVLVVFVGLLFPCTGCVGLASRRLGALNLMRAIDTACRNYATECGRYPVGTPSEIASSLTGKTSPHHIIFLEVRAKDRNAAGELVDPWQTPIRFEHVSAAEPPQLTSAGPDRVFGTPDDIRLQSP